MIKLITFDLDNTLWEVTPAIVRAEKTMRSWLTARVPDYQQKVSGELMTNLRTTALTNQPQLRYNISDMRLLLLREALSHCGVSARDAAELATEAFAIFMAGRNDVDFYPEALPMIEQLAERYRLAALTNGNADISGMPLAQHFEFSMSPDQVQARKPEPEIFSATLERAGCQPHEVVHVGDHLHEDVDGARAAGWQAIWVNLAGEDLPGEPNYSAVVQNLSELPGVIASLQDGAAT